MQLSREHCRPHRAAGQANPQSLAHCLPIAHARHHHAPFTALPSTSAGNTASACGRHQHAQPRRRHCKARSAAPQASGATATPTSAIGEAKDQATLTAAWSYLKEFSLKNFRGLGAPYLATPEKRAELRQALKLAYDNPWPSAGWVPPRTVIQDDGSSTTSPSSQQQQQGTAADASASSAPTSAPPALVMIGLMAGDVRLGARAMRDYCGALGLTYTRPESRVQGVPNVAGIEGNVYMKYNSMSQVCYVSPYLGKERGVLLQLGVEQLGHFPLGLWDEDMTAPPPQL